MYRLLASVVCAGGGGRTATHRNVSVHITGTRLVNCTACLFVWVDSEGVQLKPESCPCPVNSWGLRYEGKHVPRPTKRPFLIRKGSKQGVQIPAGGALDDTLQHLYVLKRGPKHLKLVC